MQESQKQSFEAMFHQKISLINKALGELLPKAPLQIAIIEEALSYSLFAGGKRIRPLLLILTAELCGSTTELAMPAACAIEFIHTYSLIHDDLPAMDNDDLRRGKPTSHKVFGDAVAILAGDALLTHAFDLLSKYDAQILKPLMISLVNGAGISGMLGGQVADMLAENVKKEKNMLLFIHEHKTAALITASVKMGGLIAGVSDEVLGKLKEFSTNLGLAFQVIDDILDVTGDESEVGKKVGKDQSKSKCTFPGIFGLEKSQEFAKDFTDKARNALSEIFQIMSDKADTSTDAISKIKNAYTNLVRITDFLLIRSN